MRAAFGILPELLRVQLWVVPSIAASLSAIAALALIWIDQDLDAMGLALSVSTDSARAVLTSISGAMISFTALVFSVTMLVLQMASTQLSPRVARSFLRDRFNQSVLGLFVATFVFSLLLLTSVSVDAVPQLGVLAAIGLVMAAILAFVVYLDHMAHAIRPTSVMQSIAIETSGVISNHYPELLDGEPPQVTTERVREDRSDSVVTWVDGSGYIQSIDDGALQDFATGEGHDVNVAVGLGEFLTPGMTLLRVADGTTRSITSAEAELEGAFYLGDERTMTQDPAFGIRQLVDVALRALSPSLNDPTTANQVIDRLGELLRDLGSRHIESPRIVAREDGPTVRIPAPDWEAFLELAVDEISTACRGMPSVATHLRHMLEGLRDGVSSEHGAAISRLLVRLDPGALDESGTA